MLARAIALAVGVYYLLFGLWAFLTPRFFYDFVAGFPPFNVHLFHDAGAFQVGLGTILLLAMFLRLPLRPALLAVLIASVLHLVAHIEDLGLGGHPALDLPVLALICVALGTALLTASPTKAASTS